MRENPHSDQSDLSTPFEWRYYTRRVRRHPILRAWRSSSQRVKNFLPSLWRRATQRYRQLPSAIILGAQKAGTTQLFAYLIKHPQILPGSAKEIIYFSQLSHRPVEWYRSQFPLRSRVTKVHGLVLEASPSYMSTPAATPRMHQVLPDARLIVVLRDPVSRAFSGYQHAKTRFRDSRPFHQAVDEELRQAVWKPELGQALRPGVPTFRNYVMRGYYALQLEVVFAHYSREQVLILDSAELFADTNATCQRVFQFLGVEPFEIRPEKIYNRGYYSEKIEPHVAQRLREHYQPYDALLEQITGRRFSWMKSPHVAAFKPAA